MTRRVIQAILGEPLEPLAFWNVNLPHLDPKEPDPDWVQAPLDPSPLPLSYQWDASLATYSGVYADRVKLPDSDIATCFRGQISVTKIRLG
jgi:5'-nucleotidase